MKTLCNPSVMFLVAGTVIFCGCERSSLDVFPSTLYQASQVVEETAPVLEHIWPLKGKTGTLVHLYGKRFSKNAADNLIWFGEADAMSVAIISTQELVATVPDNSKTGPIRITINGQSYIGPVFTVSYEN